VKTPIPEETRIIEVLPMSLRTAATEETYQLAKLQNKLKNLDDEEVIHAFKYWGIIQNTYPYDSAYKTCHMLLPRRKVATYDKLNWREKRELRQIIDGYCQQHYHVVQENMAVRRSVMAIYHLHLLTYKDRREEFVL